MKTLRDKIADIIDRETNARLMQDEIDILNGHEVAQSIIAALPDMEAQAAEIARLRDALVKVVAAGNLREQYHALPNERASIGSPKSSKGRARVAWLKAFRRADQYARAALEETKP